VNSFWKGVVSPGRSVSHHHIIDRSRQDGPHVSGLP
jgi:hypothetical protein